MKFYQCAICGQIVQKVKDTNVPLICCGETMFEIVPGVSDAAQEKHVPVVEVKDNEVIISVGSLPHPMEKEHYIEWIVLKTKQGFKYKMLKPNDEPIACFRLCENDSIEEVYAYCNIHGLWKADIK